MCVTEYRLPKELGDKDGHHLLCGCGDWACHPSDGSHQGMALGCADMNINREGRTCACGVGR